jgi:hypothetical protein
MSSFQGSHGGRHAEDCAPLQQFIEQMCAVFIKAILDNDLRYPTKSGVSDARSHGYITKAGDTVGILLKRRIST